MSVLIKLFRHPCAVCAALLISFLTYYIAAALTFPDLFNIDGQYNHAATSYLSEHKKIPIVAAHTDAIMFTDIGTTRSLRPPFSFIVSAMVSNTADSLGILTENTHARQRLGASLLGALTVAIAFFGFYIAFKHIGLALLGAMALGLMPKFLFLASSNNDDIGALFSTSALFVSVLALKEYGGRRSILFLLAASLGLILQSKYTAWLVLPVLGAYSMYLLKADFKRVISLSPLLLLAMIAAGAWWPIFNMVNYGVADPTALNHAAEVQVALGNTDANQQGYHSVGLSTLDLLANHDNFLVKSYKSFIGYIQWLELEMGWPSYVFYGLIFLLGLGANIVRLAVIKGQSANKSKLDLLSVEMVCFCLIIFQCAFYLHHNLVRDIQPQARYVLPVIVPLLYLFLSCLAAVPKAAVEAHFGQQSAHFQSLVAAILIASCLLLHTNVLANHIVPSYQQSPFHTDLKLAKSVQVADLIKDSSADLIMVSMLGGKLELKRMSFARPSLLLDKRVCDELPPLALLTMDTDSLTRGGFYIRVDKAHEQRFEHLNWSPVSAGKGRAMFVISSKNCTGLMITLGKTLHQLVIDNIQIRELRVNKHGKPI